MPDASTGMDKDDLLPNAAAIIGVNTATAAGTTQLELATAMSFRRRS
ncbi:MAG: hypothetical protein KA791_15050 [Flavobacteriales bacterium]|nr:hypothetical protein [Flavobacteriales bacterium]